jgi:hypothetical protein
MVNQMFKNKLLRGVVVVEVEVDRLFRLLVDWAVLQPDCLGSSDHHFLQPVSLLPPLTDCLCLQQLHTVYLGRHGLLLDLGQPGLHPDYPGLHHPDYLGLPGLHHPDYLGSVLPDCLGCSDLQDWEDHQ